MSIVVKTWKPAQGCEACAQAERLFDKHTQMRMHSHGEAMQKIRALIAENEALRTALTGMVKEFGFDRVHFYLVHDEREAIFAAMDALAAAKEGA